MEKLEEKLRTFPLYARFGEQIRFLLAGGANTAFGYGLFALGLWALTPWFSATFSSADTGIALWINHNSYAVIQWITWALSVPFGAFTLKYFAFRSPGPYLPQALRSYGVYLPAQIVSNGLLLFFVNIWHWTPLVGQLGSIAFSTVISYLGHKFFTFHPHKEEEGSSDVTVT